MKKYIIIIVALVAISSSAFSQLFPTKSGKGSDKDVATYSDLNSNTGMSFARLDLGLLDFGISKTYYMSLDPEISVLYQSIFAKMSYNYTYVDLNLKDDPIQASSVYGDGKQRSFEVLGGYYFRTEKEGKIPIVLKSESIGARTTLTTVTNIDGTYETYIGPEMGFSTGYRMLHVDGQFAAEKLVGNNNYVETITPADGHFTTMQDFTLLFIGGSFGSLTDVSATFSEYGEKSNKGFKKYYFHIILPLRNNIDDVYWLTKEQSTSTYPNTIPAYSTRYRLTNKAPKTSIGWRIGAEYHAFGVVSGGSEIMVMPGISQSTFSNVFVTAKIRIGIPYKF